MSNDSDTIDFVVLTISKKTKKIDGVAYDYEDIVSYDSDTGECIIMFCGQNQGRDDQILINAIDGNKLFKIYYRKDNNEFNFYGSTNNATIIRQRSVGIGINAQQNEKLLIKLKIDSQNIKDEIIYTNFTGTGKYKKAVFIHSGLNIDLNVQKGIHCNFYYN
jgi:hypothetical protein